MTLKFRAECEYDAKCIIGMIYFIDGLNFSMINPQKGLPDVTVTIDTKSYNREQVIDVMKSLIDSHVMIETIQQPIYYTGERIGNE